MEIPLQIVFRNIDPSPAVEADIRDKAAHLERFAERIKGCRVVIEAINRTHHQGKLYNCAIHIDVPRRTINVGHVGPKDHSHEDVYVAIRDAFIAAGRRLEDHMRHLRGEEKTHEVPLHGKIARLFPDGFGFVELPDGQEVYFHRNSVRKGSFSKLAAGQEVRLSIDEEESDKGPQATSVTPIGKHRDVG